MSTTTPDAMGVVNILATRLAQLEVENAVLTVTLAQVEEENAIHRAALVGPPETQTLPVPSD